MWTVTRRHGVHQRRAMNVSRMNRLRWAFRLFFCALHASFLGWEAKTGGTPVAVTDSFDSSLNIKVLRILPGIEHSKLEL